MPGEGEFQGRIERIEELIHRLEAIPDAGQRNQMRELLQAVLELHGAALERMLAIVAEVGDPELRLGDALLRDSLVTSLLLLHGLHPHDLNTRVRDAIEKAQGVLRGYGARVTFVEAPARNVRLEVNGVDSPHTAKAVRTVLEEEIYGIAPDAASLTILGLEHFETPWFVPLEQILAAPVSRNEHAFAGVNGAGAV
jgi:hypothetical protein